MLKVQRKYYWPKRLSLGPKKRGGGQEVGRELVVGLAMCITTEAHALPTHEVSPCGSLLAHLLRPAILLLSCPDDCSSSCS